MLMPLIIRLKTKGEIDMTETKIKSKDGDKIESSFWEPKVNEEIIGELQTIRLSKWGKDLYDLKVEGKIVTIMSSVDLAAIKDKDLLDKKIRVKYLGFKIGTGKNKYRDYEVYLVDE